MSPRSLHTLLSGRYEIEKLTFMVRDPNYSDEGTPIKACHPDDAAELYADRYDSDHDYAFQSGEGVVLEVTSPDGTVTRWRVRGEQTVTYHSREVDEDGENV